MKKNKDLDFNSLIALPVDELAKTFLKNAETWYNTMDKDELNAIHYKIFINDVYDKQMLEGFKEIESLNDKTRSIFEVFHKKMANKIAKFIEDSGHTPPVHYIAEKLMIAPSLVQKHLDNYQTIDYMDSSKQIERIAADQLKNRVLRKALEGDLKAAKLYLTHIDKDQQTQPQAATMTVNNFIQVNNIFINQDTIHSLPEAKQKAIEEIILAENLSEL